MNSRKTSKADRVRDRIRKWWEGEREFWDNDPNSSVAVFGWTERRHWTANLARAIVAHLRRHWQFWLTILLGVASLLVAL